ncbi:MAG: UDP-2,3-diacylglucosamine diphosphatase LpxI [Paracoccaceae bacterium]
MIKTAIIAGQGMLPVHLSDALAAEGEDHLVAEMEGFPSDLKSPDIQRFRVERLAPFLDHLTAEGVTRVVFAGSIRRPRLEPGLIDPKTATLVPRLLGAVQKGDDALLREVISIFADWGFDVVGADVIAPGLVPGPGVLVGAPSEADRHDAARAAEIVAALGQLDTGQGAVVAQGLCLAVETLPGTDAMLGFVAAHAAGLRPDPLGAGGVLYKAPKPHQDRRIDLPVIGRDTVRAAAAAGLAGIVWEAGGIMLLDREATIAAADESGLFLWAREP